MNNNSFIEKYNDNRQEFYEWINHTNQDNKQLWEKVSQYGEMFSDMVFEEGTKPHVLACYESVDDGYDNYDGFLPVEIVEFSYDGFRYLVDTKLSDCVGYFENQSLTLCVKDIEDNNSILHEMIHLHENLINNLNGQFYYHDCLVYTLYSQLRGKLDNLDELIEFHINLQNQNEIGMVGGEHDLLFLLKSFDIDLRLDVPLGTIFCYGYEDILND